MRQGRIRNHRRRHRNRSKAWLVDRESWFNRAGINPALLLYSNRRSGIVRQTINHHPLSTVFQKYVTATIHHTGLGYCALEA